MMEKDPKKRITAQDALSHPWLNLPEEEMNDEAIELESVSVQINEEQKQPEGENEEGDDAGGLVTTTPVMAGKDVRKGAPATPLHLADNRSDNGSQTSKCILQPMTY